MRLLAPLLAASITSTTVFGQEVAPETRIAGYMQRECSDGKERLLLYSPDDNRVVYEEIGDYLSVRGTGELLRALGREKKLIEAHCHAVPTDVYINEIPGGKFLLKNTSEEDLRNLIARWRPSPDDFATSLDWQRSVYAHPENELRHLLVVVEEGREPVVVEYGFTEKYRKKFMHKGSKIKKSDITKAYKKEGVKAKTFEELQRRLDRKGKFFVRELSY